MKDFPIPEANVRQKDVIVAVTKAILLLSKDSLDESSSDSGIPLMLGYFEQLLNGLIYELFFPDELHAHKLFLFDYTEKARLPVLESLPEARRAAALQEASERLYNLNHPIRDCLFSLRSLPTVRLIEGEHEEAASILPGVIDADEDYSRQTLRKTA